MGGPLDRSLMSQTSQLGRFFLVIFAFSICYSDGSPLFNGQPPAVSSLPSMWLTL